LAGEKYQHKYLEASLSAGFFHLLGVYMHISNHLKDGFDFAMQFIVLKYYPDKTHMNLIVYPT